jgi:hypothetical protein
VPFGVAGLGERRRLAGTSSRSPPSSTYVPSPTTGRNPAPLDLRKHPQQCHDTCAAFWWLKSVTGSNAGLAGRGSVR